ncbi:hypothetical protein CB1_000279001 [Camelus ferus]|nr:hypothetical protein CB1_000279001 [Camelus ferus]
MSVSSSEPGVWGSETLTTCAKVTGDQSPQAGRDRPPKQPPTFQKATVVSIKNPSPALPTANNTVSHVPTPSSQPQALAEAAAITSPLSSAGVAYAIISTAPSNAAAMAPSTAVSVVSDSIKVQPLLISADNKDPPSVGQCCGPKAALLLSLPTRAPLLKVAQQDPECLKRQSLASSVLFIVLALGSI